MPGAEDSRPVPDPTVLTTSQLLREVLSLRELMEAKLTIIDAQVAGHRELQIERTQVVDRHFEHLDKVRSEDKREARSLVDLALAAQKEASSTALTAANLAIDKAAIATDKRYDTLATALEAMRIMLASMMPRKESEARHAAHETALGLLGSRLTAIESVKQGQSEQRTDTQMMVPWIVALISLIGLAVAVAVALSGK